jgi:hypothetical protein
MLTYDLQLLQTHRGGLEELARRAREVEAGRGLVAKFLKGLVGGEGYHARVAELAEAALRFEYVENASDARFASIVGFGKFCLTLPNWPDAGFYGFDWNAVRAIW